MPVLKSRGEQLRFGIVGSGRIAEAYLQAFQNACNARLVAVADTCKERATQFAAKAECKAYRDHLTAFHDGKLDAVIVSTPPSTHADICLDAINAGVAVLCEKPVCLSATTARSLQRVSREKNVPFTMGSKFRYAQDVLRAHEIIHSGTLGEIVLLENSFMSFVNMSGRWNADPELSGGGVLIDNGTHSVDIMRYLMGPLESIQAFTGKQIQNLPVEDTVHVVARAATGATGHLDLSWSINKQVDDFIAVYGHKGTLRVGWRRSYYRQAGTSEWVEFGNGYNKTQAFRDQIENFSAAVQGLERLVIGSEDAVASVEAIQAAYRSIRDNSCAVVPAADELVSHAAA